MKKNKFGKEIFFLFIGFLLLLSLILCVYVISVDREYIQTTAIVEKVTDDKITYSYVVKDEEYKCKSKKKDGIKVGDKIKLYYHKNNVEQAKLNRTSNIIFLCPLTGLILCVIGVVEVIKKKKKDNDEDEEQYKTKVISVLGQTQKLKIITDGDTGSEYAKSLEETMEVPVKAILKKKNEIEQLDKDNDEIFEKSIRKSRRKVVKEDKKIIPNYYYVSNGALVYEEFGKGVNEIDFADIKHVLKVVNKDDNVVKLVVSTKTYQVVLTNMGKCDIEVVTNLLHNKLIALDENFEFEVENKKY